MEIVPVSKEYVRTTLGKQGVVCVTGVYGSGKGLIADWIARELAKERNKVMRVSYKDLPTPTVEDIPVVVGYKNYLQLHTGWRKMAEGAKKRGKKLILVIEEIQQVSPNASALWQALESLHYYQKAAVRIVLTAQPAVLDWRNVHWRALTREAMVYPRRLNIDEVRAIVGASKYCAAIWRLSHGHYGTVKYIAKLLVLSKFKGKNLTEVQVVKWAKQAGMAEQFADIIWNGLSNSQRRVLRQFVALRGRIDEKQQAVSELIKTGMLRRGGRRLHFYADWLVPFVREYLARLPAQPKISKEELRSWGVKEQKLIESLAANANKTLSYSELADLIGGEKSEDYSLWALTRLVSRVKRRLEQLGYGGMVVTERGVGYRWVE